MRAALLAAALLIGCGGTRGALDGEWLFAVDDYFGCVGTMHLQRVGGGGDAGEYDGTFELCDESGTVKIDYSQAPVAYFEFRDAHGAVLYSSAEPGSIDMQVGVGWMYSSMQSDPEMEIAFHCARPLVRWGKPLGPAACGAGEGGAPCPQPPGPT